MNIPALIIFLCGSFNIGLLVGYHIGLGKELG